MKVSIFGSAQKVENARLEKHCQDIGLVLGNMKAVILTGASIGAPELVRQAALSQGSNSILYSPTKNIEEHGLLYDTIDLKDEAYEIKYISGFTARSLEMILNSDLCIVIGGRMGTLSEFTIAYEEGKDIIVFSNTGGIAESLEHIVSKANKDVLGKIHFVSNLEEFKTVIYRLSFNQV
jgi:uncharacterized protein (TIGR00725 family)